MVKNLIWGYAGGFESNMGIQVYQNVEHRKSRLINLDPDHDGYKWV